MLVRDLKRLVLFVVPVVFVLYGAVRLCTKPPNWATFPPQVEQWIDNTFNADGSRPDDSDVQRQADSADAVLEHAEEPFRTDPEAGDQVQIPIVEEAALLGTPAAGTTKPSATGSALNTVVSVAPNQTSEDIGTHRRVYSVSTKDRKFFYIHFADREAINPNIIPHPTLEKTWYIVSQQHKREGNNPTWFTELVCEAVFQNDALECISHPSILPIGSNTGIQCDDGLEFLDWSVGPHDARVFYGPDTPFVVYGSNSRFTCFGLWIQDYRTLVDWPIALLQEERYKYQFRAGTEIQRPPPWNRVEKNWFPFWDISGQMYVHHDIWPKRAFSTLALDGTTGPDLAPLALANDEKCMAKWMPSMEARENTKVGIHQATNSLAITMCNRTDPTCQPTADNTFLFTIFQHKTYHDDGFKFHSVYEPYVMVYRQSAPFDIHAISSKPFWIHGREWLDEVQTLQFYIVSMSWAAQAQKYHGFMDDILFLSFGIEDKMTAAIDIVAGDLFKDLGFCFDS